MNICEHLSTTAQIIPDRCAIRFEGESYTYEELDRLSAAAASELLAEGIRPGDRVALMLGNVPAFAVWYFGALRAGAVVVSISTRSAAPEVEFLLSDCGATVLVTEPDRVGSMVDSLPASGCRLLAAADCGRHVNNHSLQTDADQSPTWIDRDPQSPALILYTSGTTGFPKGATLSHANVRSNVHAFNHLCDMRSRDRILLAVPLFHCFGQNALLNSGLNAGATLILQRRFDLNESKSLIRNEQVTQLYGVPMMFQLFLDSCTPEDLSSVDYCFSAAALLPLQVNEAWRHKFGQPIFEGYGLTETSPFASYNHRLQYQAGTIGTPVDSVEMKIVDTDTGATCPPGVLGEIAIRGPNVMLGYWGREAETREAIRDGWFHSGDIGSIDERGYFRIVDRVKDMIAVGGLKVFPAEVERVLRDHPHIMDAAVVGQDDPIFGEHVVAFLILGDSSIGEMEELVTDVTRFTKARLANYKVPRKLLVIEQLPRNPSGKVLKNDLRQLAANSSAFHMTTELEPDVCETEHARPGKTIAESSTSVSSLSAGSRTAQHSPPAQPQATLRSELEATHAARRVSIATTFLQALVKKIAELDEPPAIDARLLEEGLDSLMIVELGHQLQIELGPDHPLPPTLIFDHPRIRDLAEYVVEAVFPDDDAPAYPATAANDIPTSPASADLNEAIESMTEEEALNELLKEIAED